MKRFPRGLYAIVDTALVAPDTLVEAADQAMRGGATLIQYRDKGPDQGRRGRAAAALLRLCRHHRVPLIINDDVQLARGIGADGVHLGRDDPAIPQARELLGARAIIGASCYNQLELAVAAETAGADYVAFGSFFPSPTKPEAVIATPDILQHARIRLNIPLVAIGGITPQNGAVLIEAGADALAVIHGVFGQSDPAAAVRRYSRLFAGQGAVFR